MRLPMNPTTEQISVLAETSRQFTEAFNAVCIVAWNADEKNGVELHHMTYRSLKDKLPLLVSDLHIQARVKATEAIKSAFTRRKQGRVTSCPHSDSCPPRYNVHTFKIDWQAKVATLSTTDGRQRIPFTIPDYFLSMTGGKVCTADLISRNGRWWLHVVVDLPAPKVRHRKACVGVDLGISRPAVTSTAQFLGGRRWRGIEDRLFRKNRQCQSKGTKSSKRKLRKLRGKQARFRRDCDHVLAKKIVAECPPGGTIVLENLTDIRKRVKAKKRQRRRLHSWSFAQLKAFTLYKAEAKGCRVEFIDPRHTSQTCSKCGYQHRGNRRSQSLFHCRSCGFCLNADYNASRNIRDKFLTSLGTSLTGRPSSTGPTSRKAQCGRPKGATCKPPAKAGGG